MLLQQIPRYILIPNTIVCGLHIVQLPRSRTAALFFFPFESSDEIASVETKFAATNTVEKLSFESHARLTALIRKKCMPTQNQSTLSDTVFLGSKFSLCSQNFWAISLQSTLTGFIFPWVRMVVIFLAKYPLSIKSDLSPISFFLYGNSGFFVMCLCCNQKYSFLFALSAFSVSFHFAPNEFTGLPS